MKKMKLILGSLKYFIFYFSICSLSVGQQNPLDANLQLDDPVQAFENIPINSRKIEIDLGRTEFPNSGHFQGIQSYYDSSLKKQICFISRDSELKAYFITAAFDPGTLSDGEIRHIQYLPSDGRQPPLRHAGGIQLIGDYLVVGVEDNQDKLRSEIQFWDVADPFATKQRTSLTVKRESTIPKDKTAGAVAVVKRAKDHLMLVANWGTKALDFYTSNRLPLINDSCKFFLNFRWTIAEAEKDLWKPDSNWGNYQSINLICDRDFNLFLLGFYTKDSCSELIDLFSIDLSKDPEYIIQKLSSKQILLGEDVHFQYSGGITIKSSTELSCYSTERKEGAKIIVNVSSWNGP